MKYLLSIITLVVSISNAQALSQKGHRIVCEMAYQLSSPTTQAKIDTLLSSIPANHKKALNAYQRKGQDDAVSYASSCVWPDAIKRWSEYKEFKRWHYVNVARDATKVTDEDCNEACVVWGVKHHSDELENGGDDWIKAQAAMFLGHWLGDIHQPLHVSFKDDLGGNKVSVSGYPGCNNIHSVWDKCIINKSKATEAQLVAELLAEIKEDAPTTWATSGAKTWARESLKIVRRSSTKYCEDDQGTCRKPQGKVFLSAQYQHKNLEVIKRRLKQAAVRLAKVLDGALSR
ncbi:MAG: hypothetical protein COB54_07590 [Alphaproteobacteria bacterium]|nr:MAG: hypothetical protein COB54_07590 [Alphaproteobacteria bacterium]